MEEAALISFASILIVGVGAQWLAWRLRFPSILLLLVSGFLAGPVLGIINPDELLGESLFPLVSLAVALILFEGGLNLRLGELRDVGRAVRRLITIGVLITWLLGSLAAYFLFDMEPGMATLLGAILVVTGPTVIIPLLRHVRPTDRINKTLKWEGILIDPIGAVLAVLVFESVVAGSSQSFSVVDILLGVLLALAEGSVVGATGAGLVVLLLQRRWVPHYLETAVALMAVLLAYAVSNAILAESGLMAVTIMGVILANQNRVDVEHIAAFKEELGRLLLSALFVILSARLSIEDLTSIGLNSVLFLLFLIIVVRPVAAFLSTMGSSLDRRERAFVALLAPRGIVAAAVASLFALELEDLGYGGAEQLVELTFVVVVGTVAFYALAATPIAGWLGVQQKDPQGVLLVGAHAWARSVAEALARQGFEVVLIDSNRDNVRAARQVGLRAVYGSVLDDEIVDEIPLSGVGKMLALTSNPELNALAALRFSNLFGADAVFQLATGRDRAQDNISERLRGRVLFDPDMTYAELNRWFDENARVRHTKITEVFDREDFHQYHGSAAVPLFVASGRELRVVTAGKAPGVKPGDTMLSLVHPAPEQSETGRVQSTSQS